MKTMDYDLDVPQGEQIYSEDSLKVEMSLLNIQMRAKEKNLTTVFSWGVGGSVVCETRVVDDVLYFGACDKKFYAADIKTGKKLWNFEAGGIIWNFDIKDDVIYFSCHDGCIYAITTKGELLWKYLTPDKISCKPTVGNNCVYFVGRDGHLHALDRKTGKLLWRVVDGSSSCGDPLVVDGVIYIGFASGNCYAINPDGSIKWRYTTNGPIASASYYKGILYFPSFDGNLYAIRDDGTLAWKFIAKNKLITWKKPLIHDNVIYFTSLDCEVFAVKTDGNLLWKMDTESDVVTPPFIHGSKLYFGSIEGNLYYTDKKTGNVIFKKNTTGKIIVMKNYGNNIFFSCYDCKVICTDLDGNKKWIFPTGLGYVSPVKFENLNPQIMTTSPIKPVEFHKEPELYKSTTLSLDVDSESVYGGLNISYTTSSSKYTAKFRYGK